MNTAMCWAQGAVFLCAILFEDYIHLQGRSLEDLIALVKADLRPPSKKIGAIIRFAKTHPNTADRSWPTLLESQSFFENYVSYLKRACGF